MKTEVINFVYYANCNSSPRNVTIVVPEGKTEEFNDALYSHIRDKRAHNALIMEKVKSLHEKMNQWQKTKIKDTPKKEFLDLLKERNATRRDMKLMDVEFSIDAILKEKGWDVYQEQIKTFYLDDSSFDMDCPDDGYMISLLPVD